METRNWDMPKFHVLTDSVFEGMKECIRDQGNKIAEIESDMGNRIAELERDVEAWRSMYMDTNQAYINSENERSAGEKEAADRLAEEKAEADLFHAAYVGMCTMHPNRALTVGHSQQEH